MRKLSLVLIVIFVLVPILPGCDGGDSLPYVGPIDPTPDNGEVVVPPPPDDVTPPPPPVDEEPVNGLQPPSPPIF